MSYFVSPRLRHIVRSFLMEEHSDTSVPYGSRSLVVLTLYCVSTSNEYVALDPIEKIHGAYLDFFSTACIVGLHPRDLKKYIRSFQSMFEIWYSNWDKYGLALLNTSLCKKEGRVTAFDGRTITLVLDHSKILQDSIMFTTVCTEFYPIIKAAMDHKLTLQVLYDPSMGPESYVVGNVTLIRKDASDISEPRSLWERFVDLF